MSVRTLSDAVSSYTSLNATVCVIGAGIAGLFAARRLAARGHRVVVLESGLRTFDKAIHDLNKVEDPRGRFTRAVDGRYRGLGGSSSQWGGRMLPMTPHDMGKRDYLGIEPWPIDIAELQRYREEIEKVFLIDGDSFEETVLARLDPRNRIPRNDVDFTLRYPKWPTFRRCNLAVQFHSEIRDWENLEVWLGATVVQFELANENGAISSVIARDFGGRSIRVSARQFLFAAGTIEVTRLLLMLDITSHGRAFERCDALGRYFSDHLASFAGDLKPLDRASTNRWFGYYFIADTRRNMHIETTPLAQEEDRVPSAFAQVLLNPPEQSGLNVVKKVLRGIQRGELDWKLNDLLHFLRDGWPMALTAYWRYSRKQLYIPEAVPLTLNIWAEQIPTRQNRITLSNRQDRLGSPIACIEWGTSTNDERTFRTCIKRLTGYWDRTGLSRLCPVIWSNAVRDSNGIIAGHAVDLGHPACSTRMGNDPASSVVGPDLRCHHVTNAWVASASVFPSMGSANPTYTIIQIALRASDGLVKALGSP